VAASYLSPSLGLPPSVAEAWREDVSQRWDGGAHPYTRYRMSAPLAVLPGAGEVEALGDEARVIVAISLCGKSWK
jgi:hypothetical protein